MNMQTTPMWMNPIAIFTVLTVGVAPVPTIMDDGLLGTGGAESTIPCTMGVASTLQSECEQWKSLRELDSAAYAAESEECDCILVVMCSLTDTHTDFITKYADDGTVLSHEAIVSCAYGKCDVEIDLD